MSRLSRALALLVLLACEEPRSEPPEEAAVAEVPEVPEPEVEEREVEEMAPSAAMPTAAMPTAAVGSEPLGPPTRPVITDWLPDRVHCVTHGGRRFCDGPRRVPRPHGDAQVRAERLGLGVLRAAAKLTRTRPDEDWKQEILALEIASPRVPLYWPVDGARYGRGLGPRRGFTHRGIDFACEADQDVHVVADGLVAYANNGVSGYGNFVVVLHGDSRVSAYAHLREAYVTPGQVVERGAIIGAVGNTGISRGAHLHFEWREDGRQADPMPLFPRELLPERLKRRYAPR